MLRRTLKTVLGNPLASTSGANVQQLGAAFARAASSFLDKKSVTERVVKVRVIDAASCLGFAYQDVVDYGEKETSSGSGGPRCSLTHSNPDLSFPFSGCQGL